MDDFKVMARLLAAIRAAEENPPFSPALVSPKALKTTEAKRDLLAIKLQKAGYIEGVWVEGGIDNLERPVVLWNASHPEITLKGLEYIADNQVLRKAGREIIGIGENIAAKAVAMQVDVMFGQWQTP